MSCEGCAHWRRLNYTQELFSCHFAYDTRKCRLVPASECTHNTKETGRVPKPFNWGAPAKTMYRNGDPDDIIASAIHLSVHVVREWRERNGLQPI